MKFHSRTFNTMLSAGEATKEWARKQSHKQEHKCLCKCFAFSRFPSELFGIWWDQEVREMLEERKSKKKLRMTL